MKTKELNEKAFQYIIDCIDAEGTDKSPQTDKEKVEFLLTEFLACSFYNYNIKKFSGNLTNMLIDFIPGLPSFFHVEYRSHKIIELAKEWGSIPQNATEKQEEKIIDNFYNFIANKTFQLAKKLKIDIEELKAMVELDKMIK